MNHLLPSMKDNRMKESILKVAISWLHIFLLGVIRLTVLVILTIYLLVLLYGSYRIAWKLVHLINQYIR